MEIELWRAFLKPYELAVRELTIKFEHLASEYRVSGRYCPIEQVTGRAKSIPSILEKARRKNIDLSDVENEMFDKYLVMDADATVPAATFTYTIEEK